MSDHRHTAIREGGHAVVGRVLTMVCDGATIVADEDSAGQSFTADTYAVLDAWDQSGKWRGEGMGMRSVLIGRILTGIAGGEAEAVILGECDGGDADDCYQVNPMLYEIGPEDEHEARLRRAAAALVVGTMRTSSASRLRCSSARR